MNRHPAVASSPTAGSAAGSSAGGAAGSSAGGAAGSSAGGVAGSPTAGGVAGSPATGGVAGSPATGGAAGSSVSGDAVFAGGIACSSTAGLAHTNSTKTGATGHAGGIIKCGLGNYYIGRALVLPLSFIYLIFLNFRDDIPRIVQFLYCHL